MSLSVLAPVLLAARAALSPQEAVSGGVNLATSGPTLASYGWAESVDPIRGHVLRGTHIIYDTVTFAMVAHNDYSIECTQNGFGITSCRYVQNLTAGGSPGRCYRATLTAADFTGLGAQRASNAYGSATVCIPTTSTGSPGECQSPGGPIATSADGPDRPRMPGSGPTRIDPTRPAPEVGEPNDVEVGGAPEETAPITPITSQGAKTCGASPILFDLDDEGFPLSDRPVAFDLDANGTAEKTNWTAPRSRVAFLVLDRNGNGTIDDGRELFGSSTPLTTGETVPYGYVALAEYDLNGNGGNFDGFIDPQDAVWQKLRLWVDGNHNGVSEPNELSTLDQEGILKIWRDYEIRKKKDKFGNQFIARGKAWRENRHGEPREITIWDVWFVRR
jgi:hypothetical protein